MAVMSDNHDKAREWVRAASHHRTWEKQVKKSAALDLMLKCPGKPRKMKPTMKCSTVPFFLQESSLRSIGK
eukprot:11053125-Prorocentrum_lima.AAC.1